MAFVIIYMLEKSGALKFIGEYTGFIMALVGLPGGSIAGVVVGLFGYKLITVDLYC